MHGEPHSRDGGDKLAAVIDDNLHGGDPADQHKHECVEGDKMVMLAPGVYAEPSPDGVLGSLDDYSSYLGNCTAIKRYSETHPGGHTCW
ncbi:hypothetical protein LCL61_35175 [Amycolatopsis coloradensis]|uniref:Uncharacterized protein n=1 Tax=Amycolatopsis coloradensis TaxID=76021 RepID=A0ACD5BN71_9PSEU